MEGGTTVADEHESALAKTDPALVGAVISAALGVAAYAFHKASAGNGDGLSLLQHDEEARDERRRPRSDSLAVTVLESASDSLLPLAEAAAEVAGRWTAKNAPALIRERLLPRFVDAFRAAA